MRLIILLLTIVSIAASCIKNNPDPAWLEVNEWTLEQNIDPISSTGELTHNFTNAWVYVDQEFVGIFEVPFKIPILKSGVKNIRIYPTVLNNGISATKKIYPFVEPYEIDAEFVENEVLTIDPVTRYYNNTLFWIEDFEGGSKFTESSGSTASLVKDNDPSISQWGYYGEVQLSEALPNWLSTSESMNLPKNGAEVYLEVDYYNTNSLVTGVQAFTVSGGDQHVNVQINPQDASEVKWKKIYIDLKDVVSGSTGASSFKQEFQAQLDDGETSTFIILDNIKVVHF